MLKKKKNELFNIYSSYHKFTIHFIFLEILSRKKRTYIFHAKRFKKFKNRLFYITNLILQIK